MSNEQGGVNMSLTIGQNLNNYNSLLSNNKKVTGQKKPATSQLDFMTMGTVRNAVIQQRAKDNMQSKLGKSEENMPTYTDKLTICGVDYTDNPDGYKVIVPISDDIKKKIYENVKKDFETTGIRSREDFRIVEEFYSMKREYAYKFEGEQKAKVAWSVGEYRGEIHTEIENKIRELDKKWDWGQPVKKEVLNQIFGNRLDVSI